MAESRNFSLHPDVKVFGYAIPFLSSRGSRSLTDSGNSPLPVAQHKDEDFYRMRPQSKGKRGKVLIFNHVKFDQEDLYFLQEKRTGSNRDVSELKKQFGRLGFEVPDPCNDFSGDEIMARLKKEAEGSDDVDCLVVVIMTHGGPNELSARDRAYNPHELWEMFTAEKAKTLATKPKLFFIQACRGAALGKSQRVVSLPPTDSSDIKFDSGSMPKYTYTIPVWSDFLIAHATFDGHIAWRDEERGSWFIQALCRELKDFGRTKSILQIMTRVNRRVAYDYTVAESEGHSAKKQMPTFLSTLTRDLYFM